MVCKVQCYRQLIFKARAERYAVQIFLSHLHEIMYLVKYGEFHPILWSSQNRMSIYRRIEKYHKVPLMLGEFKPVPSLLNPI